MRSELSTEQRWLTWSLPALLFFFAFVHRVAPGVIARDLMQTFEGWLVQAQTAGRLPLWGLAVLWAAMGAVGGSFVLTWPIGREVNPPELAGLAVAVVNLGGFLGAALTQGPLGSVLDARWEGAMAGGARVYPVEAYRAAFWVCAAFAGAGVLMTRGEALLSRRRRRRE